MMIGPLPQLRPRGRTGPRAARPDGRTPGMGHRPPRAMRSGAGTTGPDPSRRSRGPLYAALDLGTNNCRLLIARPHEQQLSRPRRLYPHRPAGRGAVGHRPAQRRRHGPHHRGAAPVPQQAARARAGPHAPDRHRSLPLRQQRRRVYRPGRSPSSASISRSSTAGPRRNWRSPAAPT